MSATQHTETIGRQTGGSQAKRFRAPTVEEALRQAREILGDDAEIIEANRIRRGGIGGFFATELGVEVLADVGVDDRSIADGPIDDAADDHVIQPQRFDDDTDVRGRTRSPRRARQAWRNATAPTVLGGITDDQPVLPGLEQMLDRVEASERAAASAMSSMSSQSQSQSLSRSADAPAGGSAASAPTGMFAEHFLRELLHDAEALRVGPDRDRVGPDRNRVLPASPLTRPDGSLADAPAATGAHQPPRRRNLLVAPQDRPLTEPENVAARVASPQAEPAAETLFQVEPVVAAEPAAETLFQVEPVVEPVAEAKAVAASAGTGAGGAADDALAEIIGRCMQLAAVADRSAAPRKMALALTMQDGAVMKVTVELPRST